MIVLLRDLRIDPDHHCRGMDLGRVARMVAEPDRRPIEVVRVADGWLLVNGRHRVVAAMIRGEDRLRAVVSVCCDLHNGSCEPPSELCCWGCPRRLGRDPLGILTDDQWDRLHGDLGGMVRSRRRAESAAAGWVLP